MEKKKKDLSMVDKLIAYMNFSTKVKVAQEENKNKKKKDK